MNDTTDTSMPATLLRYIEAWNNHDGGAIVATFVEGGFYADPLTNGPLKGEAIAAYAQGLWQSFPDLRFEPDGTVMNDGETAYLPWKMLGTNTGPFHGLPPSGKSIALSGVDIVRLAPGGLRSVTGYFDSRGVPDQLGLQVIVQPKSIGPFTFGTSTRVASGRTSTPGAFNVTSLEARTPAEREEVRQLGRETLKDMLGMEGFIAATTVTCGNRQMTFTAWEKSEQISQIRSSKTHNDAMRRFYGDELAQGAMIGVWPQGPKVHTMQRCPDCSTMVTIERDNGRCRCGATVEAPSYW